MERQGIKHSLSIDLSDESSSEDDKPACFSGARERKRPRFSTDDREDDDSDSDERPSWVTAASQETNNEPQDNNESAWQDASGYSSVSKRLMMRMGYKEGTGLGKYGQGLVAPIEASKQRGRRGLGLRLEGLEAKDNIEWDSTQEVIQVKEEVSWLPHNPEAPPDIETLMSWFREDRKNDDISEETNFCDPEVLSGILESKSIFDQLDGRELQRARSRSNPFETLGKLFFQNRAALKMANMDAVFGFMFTQPKTESGESLVREGELLYFADVCAAPGGFSEYVLWRRKEARNFCDAKGFGFTLKENDFKLHEFFAAPCEYFEPHYGKNGDGNVYTPENITAFVEFVKRSTQGQGVHFMMADGGFSVEGQENIQEILSKRLYLCQCLVALGIVRTGGHFVCKLFDVFTPFSVGLLYLMYRSFKYVTLHKPNTSRPANSERYIVCKWKHEGVDDVYDYLFTMNQRLGQLKSSAPEIDIMELVPLEHLQDDAPFFEYICTSNNEIGYQQIVSLRKIQAFCRDLQLIEQRQAELRSECLEFWQLPDKSRTAPQRCEPRVAFLKLMNGENPDYISQSPEDLTAVTLKEKLHSAYDYRCQLLASTREGRKDRAFYLGLGGSNVFRWDGKANSLWSRIFTKVELPPDTLVYAEFVTEHRGELKAQRKVTTFHLIDAVVLNGKDVRNLHIVERHSYLQKFALALNKMSRPDLAPIRCKEMFKLELPHDFLDPPRLHHRLMKGGSIAKRVFTEAEGDTNKDTFYTIPTGLLLLKSTNEPWMMAFSKKNKRKYWFNTITRESTFECQQEVIAPFRSSYSNGLVWWWDGGVQVLESDQPAKGALHRSDFLKHIEMHR